jgi:hypothetical protein
LDRVAEISEADWKRDRKSRYRPVVLSTMFCFVLFILYAL